MQTQSNWTRLRAMRHKMPYIFHKIRLTVMDVKYPCTLAYKKWQYLSNAIRFLVQCKTIYFPMICHGILSVSQLKCLTLWNVFVHSLHENSKHKQTFERKKLSFHSRSKKWRKNAKCSANIRTNSPFKFWTSKSAFMVKQLLIIVYHTSRKNNLV